jgi:hypothetical protein
VSERGACFKGSEDGLENHVDGSHHVPIREAKHAKALPLQSYRADGIALSMLIEAVLITIDFDDKALAQAAEIDDVRTKRDLPAKVSFLCCGQAMAQMPPQLLLGFRQLPAQSARSATSPRARR